MRQTFKPQLELGATPIESIQFNPRSRDDIPQLLRGLQFIYTHEATRAQVFAVLTEGIGQPISFDNGRPGMDLWILLVLGVLRLGMNCDYDRLHDLANEHKTIRAMLGHSSWEDEYHYSLQTIKDNVGLLSEAMLQEMNVIVVKAGHNLVKKKEDDVLKGRCDSSVVETHVEYPTDTGLLWDAMRKTIQLTARLCKEYGVTGWRQYSYNLSRLKLAWRKTQQANRSRKADAEALKQKACARYLNIASEYLERSLLSLHELSDNASKDVEPAAWAAFESKIDEIRGFQSHAMRQIDQIQRRVLEGEKIPSEEKVYSIFQPHTEWINKGKAGVPVELGLKVCILEDQNGFILHHRVMEKEQDVDVAVDMVREAKKHFPTLTGCSFDKGFHSPSNQAELAQWIDDVVLPKKGKVSSAEKISTQTPEFKQARRQHSAVESAINALEQHGFDRCPDQGIDGFRSYVGLSVLARNLQKVGAILSEKERAALRRKRRSPDKLAA